MGLSLATRFVAAVAPFGQATGGPVSGLLIASATDLEYERALATVVAVNAVTCATGLALGAVGAVGAGTLVPSPGGAAGVEAALIGLLVSVAGVAVPPAAAVLLYRTATFWAPLLLCGLLAVGFGDRALLRAAI